MLYWYIRYTNITRPPHRLGWFVYMLRLFDVTPSHCHSPWSTFHDSYYINNIILCVYVCVRGLSLPTPSQNLTAASPLVENQQRAKRKGVCEFVTSQFHEVHIFACHCPYDNKSQRWKDIIPAATVNLYFPFPFELLWTKAVRHWWKQCIQCVKPISKHFTQSTASLKFYSSCCKALWKRKDQSTHRDTHSIGFAEISS